MHMYRGMIISELSQLGVVEFREDFKDLAVTSVARSVGGLCVWGGGVMGLCIKGCDQNPQSGGSRWHAFIAPTNGSHL